MNNEDKKQILDLLYGIVNKPKMEALSSISQKRDFLTKYLKTNLDFLDLSVDLDVESD